MCEDVTETRVYRMRVSLPASRTAGHFVLCVLGLLFAVERGRAAEPPVLLHSSPPNKAVVRLPNDELCILFIAAGKHCLSTKSSDDGKTWSDPHVEFDFSQRGGIPLALVDQDGELHAFLLVPRGEGRRPTVDFFYDVWHARSKHGRREWTAPRRIFEGYVGALNGVAQLESGRIVLPQQFWVPGRRSTPPTGSHVVTANYSDDGGETWQLSSAMLAAPCRADYIGSNYGACEPVVTQLADGRAWMLMRTQTGFLYESYSHDGVSWSDAAATRFRSSNSPANLLRLPDGRLVLFWNNCEDPSRVDGAPVYTTRDALHAAVSRDEGRTWRGFREVFRDPRRNGSPPKQGDRGTAYPFTTTTGDGKIILATGQGQGRIALVRIDPDWIEATRHADDFSHGLDAWSVFKPFGPAERYWRDRTQGPVLVDHPSKSDAKALHVRRPDEKAGDEAVWNFPAGKQGRLTLRMMLEDGFAGGEISLADRFIQPTDPVADELAAFRLAIDKNGQLADGVRLDAGRWYTIQLDWDLAERKCAVTVDGQRELTIEQNNADSDDVSYLRLKSTAEQIDPAGFLIEHVEVEVSP